MIEAKTKRCPTCGAPRKPGLPCAGCGAGADLDDPTDHDRAWSARDTATHGAHDGAQRTMESASTNSSMSSQDEAELPDAGSVFARTMAVDGLTLSHAESEVVAAFDGLSTLRDVAPRAALSVRGCQRIALSLLRRRVIELVELGGDG